MVQSFCSDIEIFYRYNCNMQINLFGNRALILKLEPRSQKKLKPFFFRLIFLGENYLIYLIKQKIIKLFIIYYMTDCFVFRNTFSLPSIFTLKMMQKILLQYSNCHVWKSFSVNVATKLIYILNFFSLVICLL